MRFLKVLSAFTLLLPILLAAEPASGQRRTNPSKAPPKPPASAQPAPSFETLLASDTYKVYGEIRGAGQLIRSTSVNELLEPVMKLAAPPKEFKTLVKWLNSHADAVITSRLLVAGWPTIKNVPSLLVAIEFPSPEEAAKFAPQLNEFLPKVLPSQEPDKTEEKAPSQKEKPKAPAQPIPGYYLKQAGPLLFITSTPLTIKNLRPAGSKLLYEDANFRVAHDRFSTESIFVYVDFLAIEKEEENNRKRAIEEQQKQAAKKESETVAAPATEESDASNATVPLPPPVEPSPEVTGDVAVQRTEGTETNSEKTDEKKRSAEMSGALSGLLGSFFGGIAKWPQGIGVGLNLENDSFDLRALLVNSPGEKSDAVPFFPLLLPGPAITPQSPSILPADTELLVTMSLDLDQMYVGMNARPATSVVPISSDSETSPPSGPFAAIEKNLGVKVKEDILPLLGNEIVFSMPVKVLEPNHPTAAPSPGAEPPPASPASLSPILGLALKDKEGMRTLLPKLIDRLGFKGASSLAQTERRDDTELVSLGNMLAYAFIGDFLVLSADVNAVHHVVDSYLKRETLSSDSHFKNYTRWQPRQLQGQVYVSPALMESYQAWAKESNSLISDSNREFLLRLSVVAEPVTYSLSNEGFGPLHELHIPRNLVLMAVAGAAGESNAPHSAANERMAIGTLSMIADGEAEFANSYNTCATLDELLAANKIQKSMIDGHGYKFEVTVMGSHFQATAVPVEYGVTGRLSYFVDESRVIRAGDHGGASATVADKPIY